MSIIKNNKQHVGRKRGNFGKSQKFLEPPSKKKKKKIAHGRETKKNCKKIEEKV